MTVSDGARVPALRQTVIDTTDVRGTAEFYRQLLGYLYRPGDEIPEGAPDDCDWLVLRSPDGTPRLAFQQVDELPTTSWPRNAPIPMQLHIDMTVPDTDELSYQHDRILALGGTLLIDRFDDPDEPLRVYADPAGHPFCIFV